MIKTICIAFKEPLTGIWVEGKNEFHFHDKLDLDASLLSWEMYLSRLYGANFKLTIGE